MVKFLDVDPDEIENTRESHRGRVSYPILKSFLETGKFIVELDRTGMQQSAMGLRSCLNSYVRNHLLPIKILSRGGKMYLMRLDIDRNGNAVPNWQEAALGLDTDNAESLEITPEVVATRFAEEKDKATK